MIRIIIADDHPIVRAGMKQILAESPDMVVAGEVECGEDLVRAVTGGDYDVVLLDITMPGMDGLEALKQLKTLKPGLPVLVLSIHAEDQFALRTLKAGAAGYLNKSSAPEELIKAIRRVLTGRVYISMALSEYLAVTAKRDAHRLPHERLSSREFQVLRLLAAGRTVTEIGIELDLSVKTVSTYRGRILEKTGFNTTAELIAYAHRNDLC